MDRVEPAHEQGEERIERPRAVREPTGLRIEGKGHGIPVSGNAFVPLRVPQGEQIDRRGIQGVDSRGVLEAPRGDLENQPGPFYLEPFAGSPDDNNAKFFFSGAWDVLKPYIDEGKLVVASGKAPASNDDWASVGIQGWESAGAQDEMENRLASNYSDKKVDVVLSPNDSLAQGIAEALVSSGYTPGAEWPILTGQDADKASVVNILADKQSMTVWKDTRLLGDQVFAMIESLKAGTDVEVNDTESYDNGVKVVPSYLLDPEVVTKDTVQTKLIDSGFLKASDVGL